jgi:hypothetical protein
VSGPQEESELLHGLQRAAEFMGVVRKGQAERCKGMTGGIFLGSEQLAAIETAVVDSNLARKVEEAPELDGAVFRTAQVFEEMCRRQHVDVGESMRPRVVSLLAVELLANHQALPEATTDRLEALTALQGGIGPELVREFGERFKDSRSYFENAARHASNPREHLQKMSRMHTGKYEKSSPRWTTEVKRNRESRNETGRSPNQE